MSYSRWGNSYWYTYWQVSEEEFENSDTAVFCIYRFDGDITFKAKRLREQLNKCIDTVRLKERNASEEEIEELTTYMIKFLEDVEEEYL